MSNVIWLTDRSRYVEGTGRCAMSRYLKYHFGSSGYGIARKAVSIPLATGTQIHGPLAVILQWVKAQHDQQQRLAQVPDTIIRDAVQQGIDAYHQLCTERGLSFFEGQAEFDQIRWEQEYLIVGLVWSWALEILPWILSEYRVVLVEEEVTKILGCTCGLGEGVLSVPEHEARDCDGIGYQTRADFIGQRWDTGSLAYHEFKTTGWLTEVWAENFETSAQIIAGAEPSGMLLDGRVEEAYIHGLYKGKREGTWNPDTRKKDGAKIQQSPFCYAYRKPAVPPLVEEDWQAEYNWVDESGKGRRLTKDYRRTSLTELPESWWHDASGCTHPAEWWAKAMPSTIRRKQLLMVGPLKSSPETCARHYRSVLGEEMRWRQTVWNLYQDAERVGFNWDHPEFLAQLDLTIPRAWTCRRFGKRHGCEAEDFCHGLIPLSDLVTNQERWILRRPHHQPELDQAIARGILVPDAGQIEESEE